MIRELKESEIHGLNKLLPPDWKFDYENFLRDYIKDDYFHAFIMILDDEIIGTGNVFLKDKIGWLANIIITKKYRNQGLGFRMTKFLVEFLNGKGCKTQLLIATELGEPIYQKIGFKKITNYRCFDTVQAYQFNYSNAIRELKQSDLATIIKLDMDVNGENREHLIVKHYKSGIGYFDSDNQIQGFYLPDFGRGLVLSKEKEVGIELLKIKHSKKGRRTLIPTDNREGVEFFENSGLKKGSKCSKMIMGKENNWNPKYIYSYASGYCG